MVKTIILSSKENSSVRIDYEWIRSRRTTCAIQVDGNARVIVRTPLSASVSQVEQLLREKSGWVLRKYLEQRQKAAARPPERMTDSQRKALEQRYRKAAAEYISKRAAYYVSLTGGRFERISIRDQKTRWGSCSGKGTLSFNWRLMLAPPAILDYVVVHELCHLTHMNHSAAFWQSVERVLPDYRERRKWLKEHGDELILR